MAPWAAVTIRDTSPKTDKPEPWFVAKDVCGVLGLSNITEALRGLDEDERGSVIMNTPGGPQEMTVISESGLYSLVLRSRKPEAKAFRKWVTSDVYGATTADKSSPGYFNFSISLANAWTL